MWMEQGATAWAPLAKPVSACRVALISTGGFHRPEDPPFETSPFSPEIADRHCDRLAQKYDPTFRAIPRDYPPPNLRISHTHYDHSRAQEDINCVFPLDRIREFAEDGIIGEVAPTHYSFMGFMPDFRRLIEETAPAVARALREDGVDAVLLVPV